ncbi:hypothetical protein FA13DRAFT_1800774 [Coprinellus micaceus]|uniref:Uncharacterized protein n=1 Tax=Coprinellus micaceus TaxID=71717 RepID=A0A4Y7SFR5_COPMI|nr:hypothetical protein FA13DRAFT_1800774 [Coprinellus micaceus]
MEPTQQFLRPSHHSHGESFSSIASTSSAEGDLPYANSCLEYGLDLITRALTEQDPDSPRSSTSIRQSPPTQPRHEDEEIDHGVQRRQQVRITFTGAEAEGEEDLRRWNNRRIGSGQSSGWEEDETEGDIRQRWRRGTVFLDEGDDQGYLDDGSYGRRPITISTDHSSDDGRNDLGPLTPPVNLSGLDDSDSGEVWLGRDDRVPSWAAPDIVDYYRNGWSDDCRKQQSGPAGGATSAESLKSGQQDQQSEWRDEDDEDVRGLEDEDDDFSPLDRLHASSSGRSVLPGGRLLLNTGSQDGHKPDISQPRARRPGSGSDVAWRDSGIWSSGLTQSRSVANLGAIARIQEVEDSPTPSPPPRLRGMRSLLLTKPIAPKRTQSDGPGVPEVGGLRELALRRPDTATLPTGAGGSRWFDIPKLSSAPFSSSPDIANQLSPLVQPEDNQSRKYHYQKPKRSQSWDLNDSAVGKDAAPVSGWEDERERATLKKEKKADAVSNKGEASQASAGGPST